MTNVEGEEVDDFIASGRVGRRNALPDILDEKHAETSTASLPETLAKLSCSGMYKYSQSNRNSSKAFMFRYVHVQPDY